MKDLSSRRGTILVAVLWSVALLSALAMAASTTFRGFTGIIAVEKDRVKAEALVTAGVEVAGGAIGALGDVPLYDIETSITLSTGSVRIHLSDEGGRIDVGKAPVEVLASLFRTVGASDVQANDLAQQIEKLRNPQGKSQTNPVAAVAVSPAAPPPGGTNAPPAPGTKPAVDQPFTDLRQLMQLTGMRPQWVAAMAPIATVFGSDTVNAFTAPAAVIAALPGIDQSHLQAFLAARQSVPNDLARLQATLGASQQYVGQKTQPVGLVEVSASLLDGYTVGVEAVVAVLGRDNQPYRILAWNPLSSR